MAAVVFHDVWFRYSESSWQQIELPAWQDKGTLEVDGAELRFHGAKYSFVIRDVTGVTYVSQGRDFVNKWARVDYLDGGEQRLALFNDGSALGWGGVFGGASRLYGAIVQSLQAAGVQLASPAAWHPDPAGRHESRWWDGRTWTDNVSDAGVAGTDPLEES